LNLNTLTIKDIPAYSQHPNGCGLSALLMLVNLPKNKEIQQFLTKVWDKVKLLFLKPTYEKPELQWAIALQYILLKAIGRTENKDKQKIYEFFTNRMNYIYDDIRVVNTYNQEQFHHNLLNNDKSDEGYLYLHYTEDNDYVTPHMLLENLHTMKTDLEIKILAELFNYEFIYQTSEDMTGAIYFTNKELKKKIAQNTKVKWGKLERLANQDDVLILYGQYFHWLAIRGVYREFQLKNKNIKKYSNIKKKYDRSSPTYSPLQEIQDIFEDEHFENRDWNPKKMFIELNDPALEKKLQISYNDLSESDRFYVFQKRKNTDYSVFNEILKPLEKDIRKEMAIWKDYLNNRGKKNGIKTSANQINDTTNDLENDVIPEEKIPLEEKSVNLNPIEEAFNLIQAKHNIDEILNDKIPIKQLDPDILEKQTGDLNHINKKEKPKPKKGLKKKPRFYDMMD